MKNPKHHFVRVSHRLIAWDAKDFQAQAFEIKHSAFVSLGVLSSVVDLAVNLDNELGLGAVKIDNVWPDRMLLAKVQSVGLSFESNPNTHFTVGKFLAELPSQGVLPSECLTQSDPSVIDAPYGLAMPPPHLSQMGRRI